MKVSVIGESFMYRDYGGDCIHEQTCGPCLKQMHRLGA